MNELSLGVTTIKDRRCVLIEDIVGSRFPKHDDIVPFSYVDGVAIFCSQHRLTEIRKRHPQIPVYGIWQIVFASLQHWDESLYVIYFDSNHHEGLFLLHKNGKFNSGRVTQGKMLNAFAFDLTDAQQIELQGDKVCFPLAPILTAVERNTQKRIKTHRIIAAVVTGFMTSVLLFFISQWTLDYLSLEQRQQASTLLRQSEQLRNQYIHLAKNRIKQWPQQWSILSPLARLAEEQVPMKVWGIQLEQEMIRVQLFPDPSGLPVYVPEWLGQLADGQLTHNADGSVYVSWRNNSWQRP